MKSTIKTSAKFLVLVAVWGAPIAKALAAGLLGGG